jgi:hypothetical protein
MLPINFTQVHYIPHPESKALCFLNVKQITIKATMKPTTNRIRQHPTRAFYDVEDFFERDYGMSFRFQFAHFSVFQNKQEVVA